MCQTGIKRRLVFFNDFQTKFSNIDLLLRCRTLSIPAHPTSKILPIIFHSHSSKQFRPRLRWLKRRHMPPSTLRANELLNYLGITRKIESTGRLVPFRSFSLSISRLSFPLSSLLFAIRI